MKLLKLGLFYSLLFVFVAGTSLAQGVRPAEEAAAEILDLMDVESQLTGTVKAMMDVAGSSEVVQKGMADFMTKYFKWSDLKPKFVQIYVSFFSVEELETMVDFYKSDAGRKLVANQGEIAVQSMKITQDIITKHTAEMLIIMRKAEQGSGQD